MFLFQISSYDDPALDAETEELLRQRLEAHSRRTVPGVWRVTDRLNACGERGPAGEKRQARQRMYGVLLLVLGVVALVPGLTPPRTAGLIAAGALAVVFGILALHPVGRRGAPRPPAHCRREARQLLAGRRAVDWSEARAQVRFDEAGMTALTGEIQETVPYDSIAGLSETARLWLLIYGQDKALLLQKKDLISGEAGGFSPYLLQKAGIGG